MCWDDSSRLLWTLGAAFVLVVTIAGPVWLILRAKGDRGVALGVWAAALPFLPLGLWLNGETEEPLEAEVVAAGAIVIGLLIGLVAGLVHGRRRPTLLALGAIGGAGLVAAAAALFVGLLAATGTCLD